MTSRKGGVSQCACAPGCLFPWPAPHTVGFSQYCVWDVGENWFLGCWRAAGRASCTPRTRGGNASPVSWGRALLFVTSLKKNLTRGYVWRWERAFPKGKTVPASVKVAPAPVLDAFTLSVCRRVRRWLLCIVAYAGLIRLL